MMIYVAALVAGLLIGSAITRVLTKPKNSGTLRLYRDDPSESYQVYVELNEPVKELSKKAYVTFKVSELK